jgi:hypothetical protein
MTDIRPVFVSVDAFQFYGNAIDGKNTTFDFYFSESDFEDMISPSEPFKPTYISWVFLQSIFGI